MTKKDYIKFADMIAEQQAKLNFERDNNSATNLSVGFSLCLTNIKARLITIFKQDNPNFNEDRFNQYIEQKVKQLSR